VGGLEAAATRVYTATDLPALPNKGMGETEKKGMEYKGKINIGTDSR
jgi:hypothetical protein